MSHDHSHSHSHSCHDESDPHPHDHTDDLTPATESTLYPYISHPHITTLNEHEPSSGRLVVSKPYSSRLDPAPLLTTPPGSSPQLLMYIPFTGQVKLHSILLRSPPNDSAPRKLKLFKNRDDLDFESAKELKPTQVIELPRGVEGMGGEGVLEVGVKRASWTAVTSITLFFVDNWGSRRSGLEGDSDEDSDDDDEEGVQTEVSYLGLKGDWLRTGGAPVGLVYESAANPADHKLVQGTGWKGATGLGNHGQGGH